jgi:Tfp pilus assembly protein PilV
LLEVLIALVIFTVGIIAISKGFNKGFLTTAYIENVEIALNIAGAGMEKIKNMPFENISDNGYLPDSNFPRFNVRTDVTGIDLKQIDLTVSWDILGEQDSVVYTTLVADY